MSQDQLTNAEKIIVELDKAIKSKNIKLILELFDEQIDWEFEKDHVFDKYENLVYQANDLIYDYL